MLIHWRYCSLALSHQFVLVISVDVSDHNSVWPSHYSNMIISAMVSQITSLTIVYPTVYSNADQRKHQSSTPLAFVMGIQWWPVNSPHKGPVTRKLFPFDDVIMTRRSDDYIDGLVQDCSNSSALAMGSLQFCTKPWTCQIHLLESSFGIDFKFCFAE